MPTKNFNKRILHPLALILLLIPGTAHANMGSPLMLAGFFHLFFGNLLIGIIEGLLLAMLFKVKWTRAVKIMIGANYFSALIGWFGMGYVSVFFEHSKLITVPLYDIPKLVMPTIIAFFLATIVLEYPFCLRVLNGEKLNRRSLLKKALIASVLAQTVSYGLLIPYYMSSSPNTIYTRFKLDRSLSFARKTNATVYYIGPDGDVYSIGINGKNRRKFIDSNIKGEYDCLSIKRSPNADAWDLLYGNGNEEKLLMKQFAGKGVTITENSCIYGPASNFLPEANRKWEVFTRYWAEEGLVARNKKTHEILRVAFATPFITSWRASCVTVLNDSIVVYQLGNQIVALDLDSRKIGLLAMGRGPVVKLDQ